MNKEDPSRRSFFKAAAVGGAAAAAAVATTVIGVRKTTPSITVAQDSKRAGYRETEHVKHYYRTTQI
jgi:nitrous oxide reductase